MKKLRTFLAAALLTIPMATLNAAVPSGVAKSAELAPTHSVTNTCYMYFMGRWIGYPC